jgi:VanZ family protein
MTTKHAYWLAAITMMILISCLSSMSHLSFFNNDLPPVLLKLVKQYSSRFGNTGFFSYSISIHPDYLIHKAGHIILYGLLGSFLYKVVGRSIYWAIPLVVLFAIGDEVHQGIVPGRSSRFGDIVLDTMAAAVFMYVSHRKQIKVGNCRCRAEK